MIKIIEIFHNILPNKNVKELKYFHPSGRETEPNGHAIHKGGFFKECKDNKYRFYTKEFSDYSGGIIVFQSGAKKIGIMNWYSEKLDTFRFKWYKKSKGDKAFVKHNGHNEEYKGGLSVGQFFGGSYTSAYGTIFNDKSMSVEFGGLSSNGLRDVAKLIVEEFNQETVLLKDLNKNKIYLVKK